MERTGARLVGEFVVVLVGVLSALAVDDFRDMRADRATERHLLAGIQADLALDTTDAMAAIRAARGRAAAADELLALVGDPVAGQIRAMTWNLDQHLGGTREAYPPGSISQGEALLLLADQRRLDLSDASFNEAISGGGLDVIRDLELRARIATHYFNARRYERADDRIEVAAHSLREAMAAVGLSLSDGAAEPDVRSRLVQSPPLVAEIKNFREFSLRQIEWHSLFVQSATDVLDRYCGTPVRAGRRPNKEVLLSR